MPINHQYVFFEKISIHLLALFVHGVIGFVVKFSELLIDLVCQSFYLLYCM